MKNKPLNMFRLCETTEFYGASGTMMNNLYEVGTKVRCTWGDADQALKAGRKVTVRPANKAEILWAYQMLAEYQKEHREWEAKERTHEKSIIEIR